MPALTRRALLSAAPLALPLRQPRAEDWPTQTIRLITPFPAGATSDSAARGIAQVLSRRYPHGVVVENRPGAGGGLGAVQAVQARPDGHTLLLANNSVLSIVPRVSQARYDPVRDLAPVAFLGDSYNLLAIDPKLAVTDFAGFVALARQRPGHFVYASPGIGSYGHIAGALLQQRLGIELLHVPFNGIVPAINAVLGGQAQAVMGPNTLPFAQSGQLRGAAVIGAHRWPDVPAVPTLPELGIADWPLDFWYAVLAPAGTPLAVRRRLHADIVEAMAEPDVQPLLARVGLRPRAMELEALGGSIARDWAAVGDALKSVPLS